MRALGLDVGNGYAYVSLLDSKTDGACCALPANWSQVGMPTEAYVNEDGSFDVGLEGASSHSDPGRVIRAIKRYLRAGNIPLIPTDGKGPRSVKARDAYAAIAKRALNASQQALREKGESPLHDVVVTYPSTFVDNQHLLRELCEAINDIEGDGGAHYRVIGCLPEPAAVALAYLYYMRHEIEESQRIDRRDITAVVYDLGHGTCDTALVTACAVRVDGSEHPWDLHDFDGLDDVGGINFDEVLIGLIKRHCIEEGITVGDDAYTDDLLRYAAVACKHQLSNDPDSEGVPVDLFLPNGSLARVFISRAEFVKATSPLIHLTLDKLSAMMSSAERLGLDVTHVVLSGGASQMPHVRSMIQAHVGEAVTVTAPFRPSEAVSFGASRYAALLDRPAPIAIPTDRSDESAELRFEKLFLPVLPELEERRAKPPKAEPDVKLTAHAPHSYGVVHSGLAGNKMSVLLPKGRVGMSRPRQLGWHADDDYAEIVVGRALEETNRRSLREGEYYEVCRLASEEVRSGHHYDVRLCFTLGSITGVLVDEAGKVFHLEVI